LTWVQKEPALWKGKLHKRLPVRLAASRFFLTQLVLVE
jgi:hypothetical protein